LVLPDIDQPVSRTAGAMGKTVELMAAGWSEHQIGLTSSFPLMEARR
jgi:hypothetical protein